MTDNTSRAPSSGGDTLQDVDNGVSKTQVMRLSVRGRQVSRENPLPVASATRGLWERFAAQYARRLEQGVELAELTQKRLDLAPVVPIILGISPITGSTAGGDTVTIQVVDSTGCTSASVGGSNVTSFAIVDATHVSGVTAAHAVGAADVTVTNATGTSAPLVGAFTYAGSVPVISGVSYGLVDTAGGGQRLVVTMDSSTGCTGITAGAVSFTSFAIDDATHVSGVPGAHASGVVDLVVTNTIGPSTTGTGLVEYWAPKQITNVAGAYDAEKGITQAGGTVSIWADQSAAGLDLSQTTGGSQPGYSIAIGAMHGLTFTGPHVMSPASWQNQATGRSVFWVGQYNSTQNTNIGYAGDNPLTVVGDSSGSVNVNAGHNADLLSYYNFDLGWTETAEGSALNDGAPRLYGWTHATSGSLKAYVGSAQQGVTATGVTYDTVNSGWNNVGQGFGGSADGFIGTLGSVVIVNGIISGGDLTKLNAWAQQRWGTP